MCFTDHLKLIFHILMIKEGIKQGSGEEGHLGNKDTSDAMTEKSCNYQKKVESLEWQTK